MAVKLDLSDDEARFIWCRLVRARKVMLKALDEHNLGMVGYAYGFFDSELSKLAAAAPEDVVPTGNETDKP